MKFDTREVKINKIKIQPQFEIRKPKTSKIAECYRNYIDTGKLDRLIILDSNHVLVDGYVAYLVAKMMGVKKLAVSQSNKPLIDKAKPEISHKWNVGDEVVVADRDEAYPTYSQWFDENNLAHLKPRYGNELVDGETVKVLAYGEHEMKGYDTLYAVEKQDGKIGLIDEGGLADKPKYYSGKVVCVETDKSYWDETLVVGRVYAVEDGRFVHDNGTKTANQTYTDVPGFKEVFVKAKFVEFKGEAQ